MTRQLVLFVVKFLSKIHCVVASPVDSPPSCSSKYLWSKDHFVLKLVEAMQGGHRKPEGDESCAIIWETRKSQMNISHAASPHQWPVRCLKIQIPRRDFVDHEHVARAVLSDTPHGTFNFPFCNILTNEKCKKRNSFVSEEVRAGNVRITRVLACRLLLIVKHHNENCSHLSNYQGYLMSFKLCDGISLHDFFLNQANYMEFLKNTFASFHCFTRTNKNHKNANRRKMESAAKLNEDQWGSKRRDGGIDFRCALQHGNLSSSDRDKQHQMIAAIREHEAEGLEGLLRVCKFAETGVITPEFIQYLHRLFCQFRQDLVDEVHGRSV